MPKTLELGMEVRDKVTGLTGIAVSRAVYLQGCNRILIQPKAIEDGTKLPDAVSVDEPDLEVVSDGVYVPPAPKPKKRPGGPRQFPSRR